MTDIRLPASGAIRLRFYLPNAFANYERPTPTELNAGLDIADSTSWNDFDFGTQASNTTNDPAITAKSNVSDRGAAQYGGGISFYYPRSFDDIANEYSNTYDALGEPRTVGYIAMSVDGDLSENNTPLYVGGAIRDFAAGDLVSIYKIITGGYTEVVTGEEAFRYTINFLSQGELAVYTVVSAGTPAVVVTPATLASGAGDIDVLNATVSGRQYTRGLRWTTSDAAVATVSQNGVVTSIAAGSATITGTFEATGTADTVAVTVS